MMPLHSARWFERGVNRSFPSFLRPLYQNEVKRSAFNMDMIFLSRAHKTDFHNKGSRFEIKTVTFLVLSTMHTYSSATLHLGTIGTLVRLAKVQINTPYTLKRQACLFEDFMTIHFSFGLLWSGVT